jgi:hypothetical protein
VEQALPLADWPCFLIFREVITEFSTQTSPLLSFQSLFHLAEEDLSLLGVIRCAVIDAPKVFCHIVDIRQWERLPHLHGWKNVNWFCPVSVVAK